MANQNPDTVPHNPLHNQQQQVPGVNHFVTIDEARQIAREVLFSSDHHINTLIDRKMDRKQNTWKTVGYVAGAAVVVTGLSYLGTRIATRGMREDIDMLHEANPGQ